MTEPNWDKVRSFVALEDGEAEVTEEREDGTLGAPYRLKPKPYQLKNPEVIPPGQKLFSSPTNQGPGPQRAGPPQIPLVEGGKLKMPSPRWWWKLSLQRLPTDPVSHFGPAYLTCAEFSAFWDKSAASLGISEGGPIHTSLYFISDKQGGPYNFFPGVCGVGV